MQDSSHASERRTLTGRRGWRHPVGWWLSILFVSMQMTVARAGGAPHTAAPPAPKPLTAEQNDAVLRSLTVEGVHKLSERKTLRYVEETELLQKGEVASATRFRASMVLPDRREVTQLLFFGGQQELTQIVTIGNTMYSLGQADTLWTKEQIKPGDPTIFDSIISILQAGSGFVRKNDRRENGVLCQVVTFIPAVVHEMPWTVTSQYGEVLLDASTGELLEMTTRLAHLDQSGDGNSMLTTTTSFSNRDADIDIEAPAPSEIRQPEPEPAPEKPNVDGVILHRLRQLNWDHWTAAHLLENLQDIADDAAGHVRQCWVSPGTAPVVAVAFDKEDSVVLHLFCQLSGVWMGQRIDLPLDRMRLDKGAAVSGAVFALEQLRTWKQSNRISLGFAGRLTPPAGGAVSVAACARYDLVDERWNLAWTGSELPRPLPTTPPSAAPPTNAVWVEDSATQVTLRVRYPVVDDDVFRTGSAGPWREVEMVYRENAQGYTLASSGPVATAYVALHDFVAALRNKELGVARRFVSSAAVLDQAMAAGLDNPQANWVLITARADDPLMEFFSGVNGRFTATLSRHDGVWLVDHIAPATHGKEELL